MWNTSSENMGEKNNFRSIFFLGVFHQQNTDRNIKNHDLPAIARLDKV